jgi:hypothetical protein
MSSKHCCFVFAMKRALRGTETWAGWPIPPRRTQSPCQKLSFWGLLHKGGPPPDDESGHPAQRTANRANPAWSSCTVTLAFPGILAFCRICSSRSSLGLPYRKYPSLTS